MPIMQQHLSVPVLEGPLSKIRGSNIMLIHRTYTRAVYVFFSVIKLFWPGFSKACTIVRVGLSAYVSGLSVSNQKQLV